MARPNLSAQTRAQIVDVALRLADADGVEALSTRRLATELGMRGPSLYHYFADKNALLDAVRDRLVEEIWNGVAGRVADAPDGDWEAVLRGYVEGALAALARHPKAVAFLALRPVTGGLSLAGYEQVLARLTGCGWPVGYAWQVLLAAENLMLSAALEAGAPCFTPPADAIRDFPTLRALAAAIAADPSVDEGYATGLEALIAGIRVTSAQVTERSRG